MAQEKQSVPKSEDTADAATRMAAREAAARAAMRRALEVAAKKTRRRAPAQDPAGQTGPQDADTTGAGRSDTLPG